MNNHYSSQQGATLIVSLIILAVITLLGVASIRSSNLELRMANSVRDRSAAFQTAEAALMQVERQLLDIQNRYSMAAFLPDCPVTQAGVTRNWGEACFTDTCTKGFCFTGSLAAAVSRDECSLASPGVAELVQPWRDPTAWTAAGRHSVVNVPLDSSGQNNQQVQYMVEFICFVPPQRQGPVAQDGQTNDFQPLYRVTVRAEGEARGSVVMLQSTLSVPDSN